MGLRALAPALVRTRRVKPSAAPAAAVGTPGNADAFTVSRSPAGARVAPHADAFSPVVRFASRADALESGPGAAHRRVAAPDRQLITAAFTEALGRPPTADEVQRHASLLATLRAQGKTPDELKAAVTFVLASTPEWQARASYQERLGRLPTPEELSKSIAWGNQLAAEGKSVSEVRAAFDFVLSMTPEWQARASYQERLGRLPTPEELSKSIAWGNQLLAEGKTVGEMGDAFRFVLAMTPEWQARDEYVTSLGRLPSSEEVAKLRTWGTELQAQGKSVEDMRAAFHFVVCCTPEWQARDAYQVHLGRLPNPDELAKMMAFGADLQAQGKSVPELRAAFDYVIALTPEWQERHRPRLNVDRDALYLQQPNGWTCGPTSLAMALAASGVRPADGNTIWEMVDALGARAGVGTPGGVALIADVARRFGVNAESSPSREPSDVRAALERGHGVLVNGDIGGGGHFLYLAGLDAAGNFIVCDPWRPGITSWNEDDLWAFTHHGNNPPGFAEIWPP
ncbi:MAG: C39 family peptidase [Myxococcota bacterium]